MGRSERYATRPLTSSAMPAGIPYIVGNEAAERFSYYGMRSVLVVFMTHHLLDGEGRAAPMTEAEAKTWFHLFASAVYFFPVVGALISDAFLGKYRTILILSLIYCGGHVALAVDDSRMGLAVGMTLIAIGSGGIKPCVSAHVGDQFGRCNKHLLAKVFGWFYFAINLGAFASTLLTPVLLEHYGSHVAFGLPGLLMLIATLVFWLGRREFVHVPPAGFSFFRETFGPDGLRACGRLVVIFLFVAVFWSLYDQTASAWVLQAEHMNRRLFGLEWLSSQVQAINPILIMLYIPLFSYVVYPLLARVCEPTPLRKIWIGFVLTFLAFLIPAWVEWRIDSGLRPSIAWHLFAYVILTAGEVLVSITCLEFSYTQAPARMKSFIMALFLLSVTLGNLFTSAVNYTLQTEKGSRLGGPTYYLFFAGVMAVASLGFLVVAARYHERTHLQDDTVVA
jgi:POT family proton-dependent oligopeptide transporter